MVRWLMLWSTICLLWATVRVTVGAERRVLLNSLLLQRGRFPLHDHVSDGYPVLYCYKSIERFSLDGLRKAWSGLEITLSEFGNLNIAVGNSTQNTLDTLSSSPYWKKGKYELILSPFKTQCVGIATDSVQRMAEFTMDVKSRVLLHLPVLMVVGLLLFCTAHSLSRSVTLYYGGGVVVGVLASVLILLYIFSKFVPKKNILGLGVFVGGWAVFGTMIYWFLEHIHDTMKEYWHYLAIYVLVAAAVTFAVLYRIGPITNPRTFDLIKWSLQLFGLFLVYLSTQMTEFSLFICVLALLMCLLPRRYNPLLLPFLLLYQILYCVFYPVIVCLRCFSFLNSFSWFMYPPRKRLLTQQEYEEQGRVETEKALDDLRQYCQEMPTRDVVKVMSKLRHSNKFSSFLSGQGHISTEEQVAHDWAHTDFDSSDEDEDDHEQSTSPHNSSMDSSHYSFDDSPVRPHPSPSRPQGQRSPHRLHMDSSSLHYRSPSKTPHKYHTTYY